MSKFAVGYINFFDNNLIIEIIEAEDWYTALSMHSKLKSDEPLWLSDLSLSHAKNDAFNSDMMIDVIEL